MESRLTDMEGGWGVVGKTFKMFSCSVFYLLSIFKAKWPQCVNHKAKAVLKPIKTIPPCPSPALLPSSPVLLLAVASLTWTWCLSHLLLCPPHRLHPQLLRQGRALRRVRWQSHGLPLPLHHVRRLQGNRGPAPPGASGTQPEGSVRVPTKPRRSWAVISRESGGPLHFGRWGAHIQDGYFFFPKSKITRWSFARVWGPVVIFSHSGVSDLPRPCGLQHARCPLLSPRVCSDSCPFSPWCHPTGRKID